MLRQHTQFMKAFECRAWACVVWSRDAIPALIGRGGACAAPASGRGCLRHFGVGSVQCSGERLESKPSLYVGD